MTKEAITEAARKLKRKYGVVVPEQLCDDLEVDLIPCPMGTSNNSIKGFMCRDSRMYSIVVNSDQPEEVQHVVEYHEIGHIELKHDKLLKGVCAFHEFSLFDGRSQMENEANTFVAEYLLDDERTIEHLKRYQDIFSTAASLHVPPEILAYKTRMLKYYGLISADVPISVNSNCMGKIKFNGISNEDFA